MLAGVLSVFSVISVANPSFREALHSGRVLLMDGAMGTELQRRGLPDGTPPDLWNLTHPDAVAGVHRAYVAAGAEVLVTNTFQANGPALARHGLQDRLGAIWQAAIGLARQANPAFVLASIGPVDGLTIDECRVLLDCARAADAVLFETWSPVEQLRLLAHASRVQPPVPLIVSFAFSRPDRAGLPCTVNRMRAGDCARLADELGAAAVGMNCGQEIDLADCRAIAAGYRTATALPILARPNAGTPRRTATGWEYPHTAGEMARKLRPILEAGVTLIGGCCGTTPAHIAAFRDEVTKG